MLDLDRNSSSGESSTNSSALKMHHQNDDTIFNTTNTGCIFLAGLDDVTTISKILQELHHVDEHSVLVIRKEGIRLITAGEKTFQVSAYFSSNTFQQFKFHCDNQVEVNFKFVLKDFIESLSLLRDDPISEGDKVAVDDGQPNDLMKTSLLIQYRKKGDPLRLRLENKSNYVINCDLRAFTMPSDSFCPLSFSEFEETAVIVMNSRKLYDYVSGLDLSSSDLVQLIMGRGDKPLQLITRSTLVGEVDLEITQNETEIIKKEIIVSANCLFSFFYKTQFMKPALEALRSSQVVQMKCGANGLLCIEHFHQSDDWHQFQQQDGPFLRPSNPVFGNAGAAGRSSTLDTKWNSSLAVGSASSRAAAAANHNNTEANKRSSVEYFILSEAIQIDAGLD